MKRSALVSCAAAAALGVPPLLLAATPAGAESPGPRAVFDRLIGSGDAEHVAVFVLTSSGAEVKLTNPPAGADDLLPRFSPDGRTVAFQRNLANGASNVYTVKVDGTGLTRLTMCGGATCGENAPVWTPDGRSLVFDRYTTANDGIQADGIAIMKRDGSDVRQLTVNPDSDEVGDEEPVVSPDGSTIAFTRDKVGSSYPGGEGGALMTVHIDGTGLTQLSRYNLAPDEKDWSPDGSTIAFTLHRTQGTAFRADVATIHPDGTDLTVLTRSTPGSIYEYAPSYSADGSRILYTVGTGTCADLWSMDADGTDVAQVTHTPNTCEFEADWSPKG